MAFVYLIELSTPLGNDRHQAKFYLGSTINLVKRLEQHRNGSGAALLRAANVRKIEYKIIKVIELSNSKQARQLEQRLKQFKNHARLVNLDWSKYVKT